MIILVQFITEKGTGYSVGDNITIDNSSMSANFPGSVQIWVDELFSYQVNWGVFVIVADGGVILYSNDNRQIGSRQQIMTLLQTYFL